MKTAAMFLIGGGSYTALELLWRGRSHESMFVLGGICFLLLGGLTKGEDLPPLWARMILGAMVCTGGELLFGLLFNRDYGIWDYRQQPVNLGGQICLSFSLLWLGLSPVAMGLYRALDRAMTPLPEQGGRM